MAEQWQITPADGWAGIAAALAKAQPGDTVALASGEYRGAKTLFVPTGVTLRGAGRDIGDRAAGTALIFEGSEVAIAIHNARDVLVSGLNVVGYAGMADETEEDRADGTHCSGLIEIMDCHDVAVMDCAIRALAKRRSCLVAVQSEAVEITGTSAQGSAFGISLSSTKALVRDCKCSANGWNGILLQCDPKSPDEPSQALLLGNQCHDNQGSGIALFSSISEKMESNECWANGFSGIALHRSVVSPTEPSQAVLLGNLCHNNHESGIALFSSISKKMEGNECWANGLSGVMLDRDYKSPKEPSEALLLGNRCHDNQQLGIVLFSSLSEKIDGNECWANGFSGIMLERDQLSPAEPSRAKILGNLCHDNQQLGVALSSSHSEKVERNECWANGWSGIQLQRDPRSPEEPSQAVVLGNHLQDNTRAGIRFLGSYGSARGNHFKGNGIDGSDFAEHTGTKLPTRQRPIFEDERVDSSLDLPGKFLPNLQNALRDQHDHTTSIQKPSPPRIASLAGFLTSGCSQCFRAFWRGALPKDGEEAPLPPDPRRWLVAPGHGALGLKQEPVGPQGVQAEAVRQINHWRGDSSAQPAHWLTYVAPGETGLDAITQALAEKAEDFARKRRAGAYVDGRPLGTPITLDLSGSTIDGSASIKDGLVAHLMEGRSPARERLNVLLSAKPVRWMLLGLAMTAGALWLGPASLQSAGQNLLALAPMGEGASGWFTLGLGLIVLVLASYSLLKLLLPPHLYIGADDTSRIGQMGQKIADSGLDKAIGFVALDLSRLLPNRWTQRAAERADSTWLASRLFGGEARAVPLILRDVTAWQEGDLAWLGRTAQAVPAGAKLITIMQVDGRLSLGPLFVEPEDRPWRSGFALFLDDDSSKLRLADWQQPQGEDDQLGELVRLFGVSESAAKAVNSDIGSKSWRTNDMLPTLPLASAPQSRTRLSRSQSDDIAAHGELFERQFPAAQDFFGGGGVAPSIDTTMLAKLFVPPAAARALSWAEERQGNQFYATLTGRLAARRQVGELLKAIWPERGDWHEYVAAALRFGIWQRVTWLAENLPDIQGNPYGPLTALREFEGLVFLGEELARMTASGCTVHGRERYQAAWNGLQQAIETMPAGNRCTDIVSRFLAAESACLEAPSGLGARLMGEIEAKLEGHTSENDSALGETAADAFVGQSVGALQDLRELDQTAAETRLSQLEQLLWRGLPDLLAGQLEQLSQPSFGTRAALADRFARAKTEADIERLVRLHTLDRERILYALAYAAVRHVLAREGWTIGAPEPAAALAPIGGTLLRLRSTVLAGSAANVGEPIWLDRDFAKGVAGASAEGKVAAQFLSRETSADTLVEWMSHADTAQEMDRFEAQLALDLAKFRGMAPG